MSHCYPCSGSGWYVSSSYLSASAEWPHLSGPFGTQDDARLFADCMIVSASSDTMINFLNVFLHPRTAAEDARLFFDRIAYDGWDDENVDIFLQLVADTSGSAIVTLLSDFLGAPVSRLWPSTRVHLQTVRRSGCCNSSQLTMSPMLWCCWNPCSVPETVVRCRHEHL